MPDPPNPTGQWKRTGPKPNVEKAKQQDMRDFFGSGSSSAATQSSAASLPKAGTSADPIDAPEEPIHTPVPESAEKHGGPAAPTPYEELPHSAGLTLSFLLSMLSPVLFGNADSGTRRVASRQVNRRLAPELLAGQLWHGYSTTPAFDSELPVLVAGLSSSRAASLLRHLQGPAAGKPGALSPRNQWLALQHWSGSKHELSAYVDALKEACTAAPGGLVANLPRLAFNSSGTLALQCLSCQTWHNVANAGRAGSSSPFKNWLQHLHTLKHEKARVQLLAEAEGTRVQLLGHAVLEPSSELDTDLLAVLLTLDRRERATSAPPVSPSPPARAPQLQPIGVEPLPQAHGNMLRSIPPKQVPYVVSTRPLARVSLRLLTPVVARVCAGVNEAGFVGRAVRPRSFFGECHVASRNMHEVPLPTGP